MKKWIKYISEETLNSNQENPFNLEYIFNCVEGIKQSLFFFWVLVSPSLKSFDFLIIKIFLLYITIVR